MCGGRGVEVAKPSIENSDAEESLSLIGAPIPGREKYLGGVLGDDGKVYGIPGHARRVLRIDPETGVVDHIGPEFQGQYKWLRSVKAGNVIYGLPCHASTVLKIVPETEEVTTFGDLGPGLWKYHGGVLANDGRIYCVPQRAEAVLRIDPRTDEIALIGGPLLGRNKWYGGLLGSDGAVYCVPQNANSVLRIDPQTGSVTEHGHLQDGGWKWHGGVIGADGAIYSMPAHADTVLKIVPGPEPQVLEIGGRLRSGRHRQDGKYKYLGGVLGKDGCIYGIPSDSDYVLRINPKTQEICDVGPSLEGEPIVQNKWQNGFVAPDGTIYGIPLKSETVLRIRPQPHGEPQVTTVGSFPGLNKWEGGVLANDGTMYCMPLNHKFVLKIKPAELPPPRSVGVAALRSSTHGSKSVPSRKTQEPPQVTGVLPAAMREEWCFSYSTQEHDLHGAVLKMLQKTTGEPAVGYLIAGSTGAPLRLESFCTDEKNLIDPECTKAANTTLTQMVATDEGFLSTFDSLVRDVVLPQLKAKLEATGAGGGGETRFYVQRPPTLRLQPGRSTRYVPAHSDVEYGHQDGELNFWMPLTNYALTRTTLWAESRPHAGDFHPLEVDYGDIACFHGSSCFHHVPANTSTFTRASLDFRVGVQGYFDPLWSRAGTRSEHMRAEVVLPGITASRADAHVDRS